MPIFEFRIDNDGYIYLLETAGNKKFVRYPYADNSDGRNLGKLKLGDTQPIDQKENEHD